MKRFISTKFFLTLQEASQKDIGADAKVLNRVYDKFVRLLFLDSISSDRVVYRNTLVYTRTELSGLTAGGKNS